MNPFKHNDINPLHVLLILLIGICTTQAKANETHSVRYKDITSIRLENFKMKVDVTTHDENDVKVKFFGPKEKHELVRINKDRSELVVHQTKSDYTVGDVSVITHSTGSSSGSRSVVTIGGKTTVIEGNGVVIAHSDQQPPMYMEIMIPAGTPLSLIDFSGKASIGDIRSSFHMQGSGKVIAGNLADVNLDLYKNAKVEIDQVERYLSITAADNSKLRLKHGDVEEMQAQLTGNSRVKYEGHAHKCDFFVTDNSKLFVSSIDERGNSTISRNGRVTVGNW